MYKRQTFFKGICSLEPGTLKQIDLYSGTEKNQRWYCLADCVPDLNGASDEELSNQTEQLISQAISSHLIADVAVGLNVSGGVDSSMLVQATTESLGHTHLSLTRTMMATVNCLGLRK